MVHLDADVRAAELAFVAQEPLEKVRPDVPYRRRLVVEDCVYSPLERDATPLCYQGRLFRPAFDHDPEHLARPWSVGTTVLKRLAAWLTLMRSLLASVFSNEVSMTHRTVSNSHRLCAIR